MKPIYLLSVQLSVFFATALLAVWGMTRTAPAAKRLYGVTRLVPVSPARQAESSRGVQAPTFRDATFRRLHRLFGLIGMTVNEKLRMRFQAAGLRTQNGIDSYFAARLLGPVAVLVVWTFFRQMNFFAITLMAAGAYLGPDLWLTARMKRRREQMRLGLPDALDLMVVCVDAGLGLDQALLRTGQELGASHPVIAEEFMLINLEQRAGKPRVNAWRDMADRTQLETVRGFATMLAQSDRFGTPISRALSTFADDLRKKRSQQAQEMAAKTTVKLMFPLVLFIFPSMFIVLLGPAALTISRNLGVLTGK
jgi:tight adherence protein C